MPFEVSQTGLGPALFRPTSAAVLALLYLAGVGLGWTGGQFPYLSWLLQVYRKEQLQRP